MLRSGQKRATSLEGLLRIFRELLSKSSERIILVLDALDECEDGRETLLPPAFLELARCPGSHFFLFITSRNEPHIRSELQDEHQIRITASLVEQDIERYVNLSLSESKLEVFRSDATKTRIVKAVGENADGQFLWARLIIQSLLKATFLWEIEDILSNLPSGLDQLYSRALEKLLQESPRRQDAAYKLLQWLTCAERTPAVKELGTALSIREGDTDIDPMNQVIDLQHFVEDVCGSLVELIRDDTNDSKDKTVNFVHTTVKEYLVSKAEHDQQSQAPFLRFKVKTEEAHEHLAGTCLTQLSFTALVASDDRDSTNVYPLLDYSSKFWALHLAQSGPLNPKTLIGSSRNEEIRATSAYLSRY
ncbi:uncharacterized protein K452DRAFT_335185, partial [Aplosporella prunicola CBS 121167]